MAEYIEKHKAVNLLTSLENEFQQFKPFKCFEHAMYRKLCETEIAIGKLPAADVDPVVHGRWEGYTRSRYIGCDEYGDPRYVDGVVYYCSNPRCRRRTVIKERYCPSCGAKMDEEETT